MIGSKQPKMIARLAHKPPANAGFLYPSTNGGTYDSAVACHACR